MMILSPPRLFLVRGLRSMAAATVFGFIFSYASTLNGQTRPGTDVEVWNEIDISSPLARGVTLTVPVVVRDSTSLANPQLFGFGPLVDFAALKHLTMTAGYLFVSLPETGTGYNVNVPLAAMTLKAKLARLKMSDRSRAEELIGLPQNPIRYRNKLILDLPFDSERWQPFLSDEVFYDFSKSAWTQNRFQAGLGRELSPRLRVDLFYMERNARQSNPTASHIVGTTLQIKFTKDTRRESVPHEEN
jgi:hypothetical protein